MLPDFRKGDAFWKVPKRRPFVLLVRATCRWRWVGALMEWYMYTEENLNTRRKTCSIATLLTTLNQPRASDYPEL